MSFINIAGKEHSMIHRKRKGYQEESWVKRKKRSTSLLATRMDGVNKKCMAHSVKCLRRFRRTAKVFVSHNLCGPHTFTT